MPQVDFAKFGPIEAKPLSRIKKISGANLHRNWVMIPHVTQYDEADITELEAFRKQMSDENAEAGHPRHAARVSAQGRGRGAEAATRNSMLRCRRTARTRSSSSTINIGVAVDTPNGLVVPVIRDVDKKGVLQLAKELGELSAKARDGKL